MVFFRFFERIVYLPSACVNLFIISLFVQFIRFLNRRFTLLQQGISHFFISKKHRKSRRIIRKGYRRSLCIFAKLIIDIVRKNKPQGFCPFFHRFFANNADFLPQIFVFKACTSQQSYYVFILDSQGFKVIFFLVLIAKTCKFPFSFQSRRSSPYTRTKILFCISKSRFAQHNLPIFQRNISHFVGLKIGFLGNIACPQAHFHKLRGDIQACYSLPTRACFPPFEFVICEKGEMRPQIGRGNGLRKFFHSRKVVFLCKNGYVNE